MKRVVKVASMALGGLVTVVLLAGAAFWLYLSLRPAGKTVRALAIIDAHAPFAFDRPLIAYLPFVDYMTIAGDKLYAGNTTQGVVSVIDLVRDKKIATISLGEVHGVAIDAEDGLGFTTDSGTNTLDVFDLKTNRPLGRIAVDDDPDAIVYDQKLHLIYVGCHDSGKADIIDPPFDKVDARIVLGGTAEYLQVDPATGFIYQNIQSKSEVAVVNPLEAAVTARYRLGAGEEPTGLALDSKDHRLFVTGMGHKVFVLNAMTGTIIARLPIGAGSDGIAYDPQMRRIYAANGFSATMTVIQQETPDQYRVLENAPTHFLGHSVVVDPATHRIYVDYFGNIAAYEPTGAALPGHSDLNAAK
jgi:DNA-binding beta-propeller fold protein YncE